METFDLNYILNRIKLGVFVNVKCLFFVTVRIGLVLDGICLSDEKYFICNVFLRFIFLLIIYSDFN